MQKLTIALLTLLLAACGAAPQIVEITDCGDGHYSVQAGETRYNEVRDCLLAHWQDCSETLGSLTTYTMEGDPVTSSFHITNEETCSVQVVRDSTKDRFGDQNQKITTEHCTELGTHGDAEQQFLEATKCT